MFMARAYGLGRPSTQVRKSLQRGAMSKGPQRIRGTQDIWGEESDRFNAVVEAFDRVRKLYAFQRIETPVFEATEVFARSIGETTDIVSKEMYTFPDRGGDLLTLRPEFTAGICRAYLSEGWQQHAPLKLATHGPVFRYERPQKGRFRQFHQLDAEIIGTDSPAADVELLGLADQLLRELGISDAVTLELNTLGDADTRDAWRAALGRPFRSAQGRSFRGQPRPADAQSAAHPRQQGAAGPPDRRGSARASTISFPPKPPISSPRSPPASTPPASPGPATRASSAASIITATPPSSSSPTSSARRAR